MKQIFMLRFFLSFLLLFPFIAFAQTAKQISLEDIFVQGVFRSESVSGFRSMKGGNYYSEMNANKEIQKVDFRDGKVVSVLLDIKTLQYDNEAIKVDDYLFNDSETKILLLTASENIYRRSVLYRVYIYDIASQTITLLRKEKVLHPSFSPHSDKVAYVFENNLYYFNLQSNETIAITSNGDYNHINGNCDWVYEEEFEFTKAYTWSAKGDYIAYYHFDQTAVPEFSFSNYTGLYPAEYRYKYPKAGEMNSIVDIFIYTIETDKTTHCKLGEETDIYIPRIHVHPNSNKLIVYRLNRLQNHLELLEVNTKNGHADVIYEETNKTYIEMNDNWLFLEKQNAFVFTSEKDGFQHIYKHDITENNTTQITKGKWEVSSIAGVNEETQLVYYMSSEVSPMDRNLFRIQWNGNEKVNLTPNKGVHDIHFSDDFTYFLDRYSSLNQPMISSIHNQQGELIRTLKDNTTLKNTMKNYALTDAEFMRIPNREGVELNAWIIKPGSFDTNKKYPVLMFQYSGPGSQEVMNRFAIRDYWWHQMLAQKGYIIVCVDGTGTGARGEEFKKKTYLNLGKYESDDQIDAAKYLAKQSFVDPARIGIWGWSYGGFMSSICLLKGAEVFKMAIAVAPVTNWRFYDNIYTERYMRTPQENAAGYDDNSPVNMVKNLKGKYLLIHGTADDNVHLQNSIVMIDELIKANKSYDSEFYPNKNHGISGGNTRYHLYQRLTKFVLENL